MAASGHAPIVVGVDPGPAHHLVLAWGADEADRREAPLHLVLGQGRPADGKPARHLGDGAVRERRRLAEHVLRDAVAFVTDRHPRLEVRAQLAADDPVPLLRREARTAAAVVLGSGRPSRRKGRFTTASVAPAVVARAACPVVIVRPPCRAAGPSRHFVVGVDVGVDGRRHSAAAVDQAFAEAALHRAALRVLYVWQPPLLGVLDEHAALRECRGLLSEMVESRRATYRDVEVRQEVVRGRPAQVLARESMDALGLVVGLRGSGGFTGLLPGSVVHGVLHRALCPVVVVPRSGGHHPCLVRPRLNRVARRARAAAGRRARLLTGVARAWSATVRRGCRTRLRQGGHVCRGLGTRG
ncbi:universal stress protein [Streptomyces spinosisporus]|uniref:Universal stress protein n=1 Tax=Streptomyces spinosisporus TaxID=2927582 RepID=A0ABS9XID9_9ACTN|nr:universal stress protein [Streptomyces spinosisporus]MCI3241839.1 universal stress protein [Streptomyces spinosisporus]